MTAPEARLTLAPLSLEMVFVKLVTGPNRFVEGSQGSAGINRYEAAS